MSAITGTHPRGTNLAGDHFRCSRCGAERKFNVSRGRPELCRDCRDVADVASETRCNTGGFDLIEWAATDRLMEQNEPASVLALTGSSTPLVTTRKEA